MARLMGQLDLPVDPERAMPLLHRAATLATLAVPQPAYVYALLLLDDFAHIGTSLPASLFAPYLPSGVSASEEAQKHLERAAFLHFSPAQYKLGHSYEFARPPCAFDPLLSVQYYSLASQAGEAEAVALLGTLNFLVGSMPDVLSFLYIVVRSFRCLVVLVFRNALPSDVGRLLFIVLRTVQLVCYTGRCLHADQCSIYNGTGE